MQMKKISYILLMVASLGVAPSCTTHYRVSDITRTRLLIDQQYDGAIDQKVSDFMRPYQSEVDKEMSPVIGRAAMPLESFKPESPLSNLLPDVLVWAGSQYGEKPDFGIYNIGGIRASLAQGDITIGDIYDLAPFENKICFLTMSGEQVLQLLRQIVKTGGEGISSEVRMVADSQKQLKRATISGKEIVPTSSYRVATIDYLSHGNDGLLAFKDATDRRELKDAKDLTRELIMGYIRHQTAQGKAIESKIEGRYIIEE